MIFLLFGSSASGKTSVLELLRERLPGRAIHEFDEVGVPSGATKRWRQEANERWVLRALGSSLPRPRPASRPSRRACSSATTRHARRGSSHAGPEFLARTNSNLENYLGRAEWMRNHARDPAWRPFVIRRGSAEEMRWERWSDWQAGDPRWRVAVVDTSERSVDEVAGALATWVADERALSERGAHPLGSGAWADWS